ncbi:MAG: c-type cytochrome [Beijerinckiaceae bacterium]
MRYLVKAALAASFGLMVGGSAMAQDLEAGQRSFNKCRACHQVGEEAKNLVGPKLNGIFGRVAGTVEGYSYSEANKKSGITWDEANFATYIKNPRAAMPGNKMAFAGITNDTEIVNLTAFLKQYDKDGKIAK